MPSGMKEEDVIGHPGIQWQIIVREIEIRGGVHQRGVDRRGVAVIVHRKIIKLEQVRRSGERPRKTGVCRVGKIQQPDGQLRAVAESGGVVQMQIKQNTETVIRSEGPAERIIVIAVGLGGIPGHLEILVRRIPTKQIGVAKNLPAVEQWIGGEFFDDGVACVADRANRLARASKTDNFFI